MDNQEKYKDLIASHDRQGCFSYTLTSETASLDISYKGTVSSTHLKRLSEHL